MLLIGVNCIMLYIYMNGNGFRSIAHKTDGHFNYLVGLAGSLRTISKRRGEIEGKEAI